MAPPAPSNVLSATFHLTNQCNLRCVYCYAGDKIRRAMTREIADAGIDLTLSEARKKAVTHLDIGFMGGEPLLEAGLLCHIADRIRKEAKDCQVSFKVSTNGTMLHDDLLNELLSRGIFISLSLDGPPQVMDAQRPNAGGAGVSGRISSMIPKLLAAMPLANANCVITPLFADQVAESAQWIYAQGFRFLTLTLDYSAPWTEDDFKKLKKSYQKLAAWYLELMKKERRFYLSCFDERIRTRTQAPPLPSERCGIGKRQFSIAADGELYPCVQFVSAHTVPEFLIGHVLTGLDEECKEHIHCASETEKKECAGCAIKERCGTWCACINYASTGTVTQASPVACWHEHVLMPIADEVANQLWRSGSRWFVHKYYNPGYHFFSQAELLLDEETV